MKNVIENYEHKVIDSSIGYFRFFENATAEEFQAGLNDLMKIVAYPEIEYLVVVNDQKTTWNDEAEVVWRTTGELLNKNNIKKWGVVTPESSIRKMTLKRVISLGGKRSYDILLSENEDEILNWVRQK